MGLLKIDQELASGTFFLEIPVGGLTKEDRQWLENTFAIVREISEINAVDDDAQKEPQS